jgi:hypothetical protein
MAKNNLQVEVNEATANDRRTITITITAPAEDFLLADLLAQRKAIPPCAGALKSAALEGAKSWLESAEQVIAGTRTEQKIAEETPPKRDRKPKAASPPEDVPSRRVKPETVNGAVAATSVSGG